jgi:hypothetical protein
MTSCTAYTSGSSVSCCVKIGAVKTNFSLIFLCCKISKGLPSLAAKALPASYFESND